MPPKESARQHVEFMGGADSIMPKARSALEAGETRWAAQVLDLVVFADPGTRGPRPPRPSPRPARAGQRRRHLAQLQPAGRGGTAREEAHEYLRHPYRAPERSRPRLRPRPPEALDTARRRAASVVASHTARDACPWWSPRSPTRSCAGGR
nr:alkyl sulfatase dimerization domain-containing protein [Actinomadura sp. RB99]